MEILILILIGDMFREDEVRLPTCIVLLTAIKRQVVNEFKPTAVIWHC